MPIKLNFGPLFEQLNHTLGSFKQKEKTQKKKIWTKIWKKKNYNKTTTGYIVAWFLRLSTLPNTTQFSTFYYFLLQYYFSSPNIYYLLLIFNYFFLFILNHTRLVSSIFTLHTFKFYHIFIYTFIFTFCLPPCS